MSYLFIVFDGRVTPRAARIPSLQLCEEAAMLLHLVVGAICANWLLAICKAAEITSGEGSQVSPQRRLPLDSNALVGAGLAVAGAVIGSVVWLVSVRMSVPEPSAYWPATAGAAAIFGLIGPLPLVLALKNGYMRRAQENFSQQNYKEAFEDAAEAARVAFDHATKQAALLIRDQAAEFNRQNLVQRLG